VKAAVLQQASPTSNTTQDWTDATAVSSDAKGFLSFASYATANNTATANGHLTMGATDFTRDNAFSYCQIADGGVILTSNQTDYDTNAGSIIISSYSPGPTVKASYSSTLSTGVRMSYSNSSATQYLINGVLVAGSDIAFATATATLTNPATTVSVAHNCGGTPDVIIVQMIIGLTVVPGGVRPVSITSVWERGGGTQATISTGYDYHSDPTKVAGYITTSNFGRWAIPQTGALNNTMTISNVGATTFDLTTNFSPGNIWQFIAHSMRGTTNPVIAKCGTFTTKTSTGTSADITGMASPPILLFTMPSRMTALTTGVFDDSAGSWGLGWSANNGGTTQQFASAAVLQQGVATNQVGKCRTSNNRAMLVLDNSANILTDASINSWDSGGVTFNYNTSSGTAYEVMYLAIAAPSGGGGGGLRNDPMMMLGVA
jgi:hypothetical protein